MVKNLSFFFLFIGEWKDCTIVKVMDRIIMKLKTFMSSSFIIIIFFFFPNF